MKNTIGSLFILFILFFAVTGFAQDAQQKAKDDKILTEYFAKNKIKAKKTASGLYYTISKKGTGENAKAGQKVSMGYKGMFLDGSVFDQNVDANFKVIRPFSFPLGAGRVIKGWDEGVQLLNTGCHAMLYLPSDIAYGANGNGRIPANSVLIFEVEVQSISN